MEWSFEIVRVHRYHNRGDFIFARLMEGDPDFQVMEGAVLAGIPIYPYVEMPRKLDENGNPRFDIFVFRPLSLEWLPADYFVEGQQVKLISQD